MSLPTPNFVLMSPLTISRGPYDNKTLPAGTFVRPIEYQYVPKHIQDADWNRFFDQTTDIFCYTRVGIVAVPRNIIRNT